MTALSDGKAWLLSIVESAVGRTRYHVKYPASIVRQNADGRLDVVLDDETMPAMMDVPIAIGVPGVTAKVAPGGRVLVSFENGDPRFPIVTIWDTATVLELRIAATQTVTIAHPDPEKIVDVWIGDEGGAPIARMGDPVDIILPPTVLAECAALQAAGIQVYVAQGIISGGSTNVRAS